VTLGRPDEALAQAQRGMALDPLNDDVRANYALDLYWARRYDDALAQANEVLRKQPDNYFALGAVILAGHAKQHYADVIAAAARQYEVVGMSEIAEALRGTYRESGYAEAFRKAAAVEMAKHVGNGSVAYDIAFLLSIAGDRAQALDWLERAYQERNPSMPFIGCDSVFDPLRSEPRFQALLRKMGLPTTLPPGAPQPTGAPS
jgi:tetratricopeptide (TPR) repeat protein